MSVEDEKKKPRKAPGEEGGVRTVRRCDCREKSESCGPQARGSEEETGGHDRGESDRPCNLQWTQQDGMFSRHTCR